MKHTANEIKEILQKAWLNVEVKEFKTTTNMTPQQTSTDLVNQFRMILMDEDTDCGNEILCTSIAIKIEQLPF
jgi:hypothetical protein